MIKRDIFINSRRQITPICVVYGADAVGIELNIADYTIPADASAVAHAKHKGGSEATYENPCSLAGNKITLFPEPGFFMPGDNLLQIDISTGSGHILTFSVTVFCDPDIAYGGDPATPERVVPLVERAETAAVQATQAASEAKETVAKHVELDTSQTAVIEALVNNTNTHAQDMEALYNAHYNFLCDLLVELGGTDPRPSPAEG